MSNKEDRPCAFAHNAPTRQKMKLEKKSILICKQLSTKALVIICTHDLLFLFLVFFRKAVVKHFKTFFAPNSFIHIDVALSFFFKKNTSFEDLNTT